jgi:hypothetical protein
MQEKNPNMQEKNPNEKKHDYPETGKQGGQGQGDIGKKGGDTGDLGKGDFGKGDVKKDDVGKKPVGQ